MSDKDSMEEGEISGISDSEEPLGQYTPLERPALVKNSTQAVTDGFDDYSSEDEPSLPCNFDSDSDEESSKAKKKKGGPWGRRDALICNDGGGEEFKKMAKAFQEERNKNGKNNFKKKNNIWGSIIQEENLNTELTGSLGVGRSLRDLDSDRGAETYDYTLIAKERREEEKRKRKEEKTKDNSCLDNDMDTYWSKDSSEQHNEDEKEAVEMENDSEDKRGTKRSIKERLGTKRVRMDRYHNEELPPPGKPRQLPDISEDSLLEGTDEDLGRELSEKLYEEKEDMMISLVKIVGRKVALDFYRQTQKVEETGGMVINNGARRRTPGGVMLHLLRKTEDESIKNTVKKFFSDSQKNDNKRKIAIANKRKKKNFEKEMEEFLNARKEMEIKKKSIENSMDDDSGNTNEGNCDEEEAEAVPLPNILSMIANSLGDKKSSESQSKQAVTRVSSFKEPDAPPNSVERAESEKTDLDFLSTSADTEDIELF